MIFSRSSLLALTAMVVLPLLTACGDSVAINNKLEETDRKVTSALDTFKKGEAKDTSLTVSERPWFGQQAINISSGQPLPTQYTAADSITLTFDQPLSLRQTANLIQSVTGIRVMVNEATASSDPSAGPSNTSGKDGFMPINGREVRGGKIIWQGALDDLLNQMSDTFDAGWSYNGATITLNQEITKTFMLHSLATVVSETSKVESGSGGSGSSGGTSLPSVESSGTTELNVWKEVQTVVASIVQGQGRATFSPSTGTITVSGSPNTIQRVEDYLRLQNGLRLRRIAISVKVLELTLSQGVNTSVSTTQLLERIIDNSELDITAGSAGLSAGFVAGGTTSDADIQTTLSADKTVERLSVVHSGAVVTLSDQPAPLQVGRQISYLARRSSTSGTDSTSGTETLEPGTIDTGLIMNVLPRVIEDDRVMLRLNVALTNLADLKTFPETVTTEQIQLPEVDSTGFQQNTVLRTGETLVLAGFERNENSTSDLGTPGFSFLLGGSRERLQRRNVTVMLITANILPEDPMSVYADNQ